MNQVSTRQHFAIILSTVVIFSGMSTFAAPPAPAPVPPNSSIITSTVLKSSIWQPGSQEHNEPPILPADQKFYSMSLKIITSEPESLGLESNAVPGSVYEMFSSELLSSDLVGKKIKAKVRLAGTTDGVRWWISDIVVTTQSYDQNLYFGMKHTLVEKLQKDLSTDPSIYPEKNVTGYFGSLTLKAVKRFQAKYGILQTGYVGPLTRAKLNELYILKDATVKPSTSPAKLDAGAPAPPADQALAEITVLSQVGEEWKVRVDKIRDYIRYPKATNPQLKVGDTISIRFNGWLDTFQSSDKVCPVGYIKIPKPPQAESTTQPPATRPQPQITVGQKYLSKLFGCFAQANCQTIGWSGWLYNPSPTVIESDCVKPDTTPIPPPVVE